VNDAKATLSGPATRSHNSPMAQTKDRRPPVAVGHVHLGVTDVAGAAQWLEAVGMRPIFAADDFAVLELRGGTHLVVRETGRRPRKGAAAPFDLMVDDVVATRRAFLARGMKPSKIRKGRIHDTFHVAGPDGYDFAVTSSHAGRRPV
jgi:hypothetical protein